jgi:hypothetical protein
MQHKGLSDVKLFGKSFLSQPNLVASGVPCLKASSNSRVTLQQSVFHNISIPVASIGTRGALSKAYGMDSVALPSVFRRVVLGPYMVLEGGQMVQPAHTTAQPGNLGLWRVNNLQPPGPSKGKPEGTMAHMMEQPAQEAHKFEVEQVTVAHPHKV